MTIMKKLAAFQSGKVRWFVLRWGPALLIMLLIFIFSSIPSDKMPDFGGFDFSIKKLGHMFGYALLAQTYRRGIGRDKSGAGVFAWLLAILYAASDEFHQSFVPGRGSGILDVGIDGLGALLGILPLFPKL